MKGNPRPKTAASRVRPGPTSDRLAAPNEIAPLWNRKSGPRYEGCAKDLDLTVAELGAAAGISTGMLSKIENGTISPSLVTLNALARALNIPISRLFSETDERRDCSFVKRVRVCDRAPRQQGRTLYDLLGHSLGGTIAVEPYLITLKNDAVALYRFSAMPASSSYTC